MEFGNLLLYLAFFLSLSSLLMFILSFKYKSAKYSTVAELLVYASFSIVLAAFLLLVYYFVTDNFSIYYVYTNSNKVMGAIYKVSATWAGREGSLLLWSLFNLAVFSIFLLTCDKDYYDLKASILLSAISTSVLAINTFVSSPFQHMPFQPSDGIGLNPLLRTFEMILHPPVIFLGYAATAVPYALHTANKTKNARMWMKVAWIFLTLGILLGSWWAYRTLGWGGFWGWDPVENASLLPWIAATAYFHSKGKFRHLNAILAFILVIFATFVTRSGIIKSVHAFSEGFSGVTYVALVVLFSIIGFYSYLKERGEVQRGLMHYAVLLFLVSLLVVLIGTITSIFLSVERMYYQLTFTPVYAAIVALMLYYVFYKAKIKSKKLLVIHLGVLLLFVGCIAVWNFESRYEEIRLNPDASVDGIKLQLLRAWFDEDVEKFTVYAKITIGNISTIVAKQYIYKIDREDRIVSSVELVSYPYLDYYLAIRSVKFDFSSVVVDFYIVPLISFVWLGSILMCLGVLSRFRSS